jgi:glycine dehydrogenase
MTDRDTKRGNADEFSVRHIGPAEKQQKEMLDTMGLTSLDVLINQTVPQAILLDKPLELPVALSETSALSKLKYHASRIKVTKSLIGMGYYSAHTPNVILRNILENPAWYTAYTPYQPEISQGRLEALLNFQTMVCDLTGMEIANASLLDEAYCGSGSNGFLLEKLQVQRGCFFRFKQLPSSGNRRGADPSGTDRYTSSNR